MAVVLVFPGGAAITAAYYAYKFVKRKASDYGRKNTREDKLQ